MEINKSNVFELMNITGTRPCKDFGQNFLIDPLISEKIVSALEINEKNNLLEIGPGIGSLTHFINLKSSNLTVVDIDSRMIDFLKIPYQNTNIKFINQDIRKVDVSNYDKVISNLPYNITTETIVYLLKNSSSINKMVLMCQAENYAHFSDISGKEYGPVSILIHLIGSIKRVCSVKPGSFYPSPKCNSVVFQITRNNNYPQDVVKNVYELSRKIFLNRRKTILNNLSNVCGKEKAIFILNKLSISQNTRPEEIAPERFVDIYFLVKEEFTK